jgi:hypothetical protein
MDAERVPDVVRTARAEVEDRLERGLAERLVAVRDLAA